MVHAEDAKYFVSIGRLICSGCELIFMVIIYPRLTPNAVNLSKNITDFFISTKGEIYLELVQHELYRDFSRGSK